MAEIRWTDQALDDLDAVCQFIARDSTHIAEVFAARVMSAVEQLEDFPESGRVVPEINRPDVREIFVYAYRIMYRVQPTHRQVQILTVYHGARLLKDLDFAD